MMPPARSCPGPDMDKYDLYSKSVQDPAGEVRDFRKFYRQLKGRTPKRLREDFCGTFSVCCEWVKLGPDYTARGLDLDEEPLNYGRKRYLSALTPAQRLRVKPAKKNVLKPGGPASDLIVAQNFSYFTFKQRRTLLAYFVSCRKSLRPGGVLILDAFGGADTLSPNSESTRYGDLTFYWEQYGYDQITHEARFGIHFKTRGRRKIKDAFTYDWRLWTIAEIRDLLSEAGFQKSHVYWEDDDGKFRRVEKGFDESAWVTMILAEK